MDSKKLLKRRDVQFDEKQFTFAREFALKSDNLSRVQLKVPEDEEEDACTRGRISRPSPVISPATSEKSTTRFILNPSLNQMQTLKPS